METTPKNPSTSQADEQQSSVELQVEDTEALRHMSLEYLEQGRKIKQSLKNLSKNQLIQLLLEQVNFSIEQQNINRVLLEKLKEQK